MWFTQFQAHRVNSDKWNMPNLIQTFRSGFTELCVPFAQTENQPVFLFKW